MTRTITAVYDSETDARFAREQLVDRGVDDNDVRIVSQDLSRSDVSSDRGDDKGVWESIKDFFVGDDDRPMYSEGMRRGAYLLTARVDDDLSDDAIAALEQTNAVDLDQRAEQWRSEGWTDTSATSGYDTGATATSVFGGGRDTSAAAYGSTDTSRASNEQAIPVVEERLRVGKREVDRGGVRVRSYVVEEPVHESVSLREEHVQVERRPVSGRSAGDVGDAGFQDRTIEVNERSEEAVVAKDAVVTEEVVVSKTADERTETIDDTVRRTEVDVDDTTGRSTKDTSGVKSGSTRGGSSRKR